jgi:HSP20 family protein
MMKKDDIFLLRERLNKLFEDSRPFMAASDSMVWTPIVDFYETPESFVVKAELPEVSEQDINITIDGNILRISGERKFSCEGRSYYQAERSYGAFSRSFALPSDVSKGDIKAVLKDGVLKIDIPKNMELRPKHIEIK